MTGITSRIIHAGLLLDLRNESATFRRLAYFSFFCADCSVFIFSRSSLGRPESERVTRAIETTFVVDLEQDDVDQEVDPDVRVEPETTAEAGRSAQPPTATGETGAQAPVPVGTALPPLPIDDDTWWSQEAQQGPMDEYGRAMGARTAEDLKTGYYDDHRPDGMTDEEYEGTSGRSPRRGTTTRTLDRCPTCRSCG